MWVSSTLSGGDQYRLPLHSDFQHHQSQNIHYHLHPKAHYNCARPLPRKYPLQAENSFEAGNKKQQKRGSIAGKKRKIHKDPYIFLQVPEGNNGQAREISNFSKASYITDSSGCLQADAALGRSCFFKPQVASQTGMPLGLPGSEHRKAGLKTHHSLPHKKGSALSFQGTSQKPKY